MLVLPSSLVPSDVNRSASLPTYLPSLVSTPLVVHGGVGGSRDRSTLSLSVLRVKENRACFPLTNL